MVAQVTAVAWITLLSQELLYAAGTARKKNHFIYFDFFPSNYMKNFSAIELIFFHIFHILPIMITFFCLFVLFCFFKAAPVAYGSSQARGNCEYMYVSICREKKNENGKAIMAKC